MLTRSQFIDYIYQKYDMEITRSDIVFFTDIFVESLKECIKAEGGVKFPEFGNFELRHRKATKCKMAFSKGELVEVPEKKIPRFIPSVKFKEYVNKKEEETTEKEEAAEKEEE